MGMDSPFRVVVLGTVIVMMSVLMIAISVLYIQGDFSNQMPTAEISTMEEQKVTVASTEETARAETSTTEETPGELRQVKGVLIANTVLMVILSVLTGWSGILFFLFYRFLMHVQGLPYFDCREISVQAFLKFLTTGVFRFPDSLHKEER